MICSFYFGLFCYILASLEDKLAFDLFRL